MRATEESEEWIASYACEFCGGPAVIDKGADPRGLVTVIHEAGCERSVRLRASHPGLYLPLALPVRQGPAQSEGQAA